MTTIKSRLHELFSIIDQNIPLEESAKGFNFAGQSDAEITRVNTENTRKRREKEKLTRKGR